MAVTVSSNNCGLTSRGSDISTVPLHRHCQKTVLSAYGSDGTGATWNLIDRLSLSHVEKYYPQWKDDFTDNTENITQDLQSILKLIDTVSKRIDYASNFRISFFSTKHDQIGEATKENPEVELGRDIELTIGGQTLSFNTMRQYPTDVTSISLPTKTLNVTVGTSTIGSTTIVGEQDSPLNLAANAIKFNVDNVFIGEASVVWPNEQIVSLITRSLKIKNGDTTFLDIPVVTSSASTVSLPTKNFNVKVGESNIATVPVTMPTDATVTIPTNTLTMKVGESSIASVPVTMPADVSVNLPTNNITIKNGNTAFLDIPVVTPSGSTVSLPTKTLTVNIGSSNITTASVTMPTDATVTIPTKTFNMKVGTSTIGSTTIVGEQDKDINLSTNAIKFNVNGVSIGSASIVWPNDQTVDLTTKSLTIKNGDTTFLDIRVVAPSASTVSLPTHNLRVDSGASTFATVPVTMPSDVTVSLPTKPFKIQYGNTAALGSTVSVFKADGTSVAISEWNISNVSVTMPTNVTVTIPRILRRHWDTTWRNYDEELSTVSANSSIFYVQQDFLYAPMRANQYKMSTSDPEYSYPDLSYSDTTITYFLDRRYNFYKLWGPGPSESYIGDKYSYSKNVENEIKFVHYDKLTNELQPNAPFIWYFSIHNGANRGTFTWKINVSGKGTNNFFCFYNKNNVIISENHLTTINIIQEEEYTTFKPSNYDQLEPSQMDQLVPTEYSSVSFSTSSWEWKAPYLIFTIPGKRSETYRFFCDRTHPPYHVSIQRFAAV